MKWIGRRQSGNVEDRRGMSGGKLALGGGLIGLIALAINLFMGGDAAQVLSQLQEQGQQQSGPTDPAEDEMAKFVSVALADNEDVWKQIFSENGEHYEEPTLVLFKGSTTSGCGSASASIGPFYCPADKKIYIDLAFMEDLKNRFGAKGGDFALAYVLAHEVGHHVQNLLGTSGEVHEKSSRLSEKEANKLSVALELQADFYAGVWARRNQNALEEGDIEEALSAASAVGDDAIQKKTQGHVVPDAFTHGTSEQRKYWFTKGYNSGDIKDGNTFGR